jgi:hypothetical protein
MEKNDYPRPAPVVSKCGHGQLYLFSHLLSRKIFLIFSLILSLSIPPTLLGQTKTELNTLFFDGVYLDDPETILLSSAARNSAQASIPFPANSAIADEQQTPLNDLLNDIAEYETSINQLIESSGTFNPRLAQEYLSIGTLYQQAGDYENAALALETTMHIERVNQGLYTLAQTEAVRKLIENSKANRNYADADKYHEYLFYLMSRSLDDDSEEYTQAVLEWADWNMEAFRRLAFYNEEALAMGGGLSSIGSSMLRQGELVAIEDSQFNDIIFVPRSALLVNSTSLRSQSFTPEQLVDPRLKKAEELFDLVLEKDLGNEEILHKKAELTYLFKLQIEKYLSDRPIGSNIALSTNRGFRAVPFLRRGYADSREELASRAENFETEDHLLAANAYIDLADWDLAFDRLQRANQGYSKARDILLANGLSEVETTKFITPEPAMFIPNFVSFEDTRQFQNIPEGLDIPYIGYIDVSFNKRQNGTLRNIKVEHSSENTGHLVRNRLLNLLRSGTVRPFFESGRTRAQSDIQVRYYYSY